MNWRIMIVAVISVIIMIIVFRIIILPVKEKRRIRELNRKSNEIVLKFTTKGKDNRRTPKQFTIERQYQNKEVISTVNLLKMMISEKLEKCSEIDNEINRILEPCSDLLDEEKYNYLISKIDELDCLKSEMDSIENEISKIKIRIKDGNTNLTHNIKDTFSKIDQSKKKKIEGSSFNSFICEKLPYEMKYFQYTTEPLALHIGNYNYCLFSNMILVFDNSGVFSSSVDPSAFEIKTARLSETKLIYDDEIPNFKYEMNIDSDSICIERGKPDYSWTYTRKDGGPDLRYKDNRMYKFRRDTYEYGKITISIAGNNISIYLSSNTAIHSFEMLGKKYTRKCIVNRETDRIAELLRLLDMVSDEEKISKIIREYNSKMSRKTYFCEINV